MGRATRIVERLHLRADSESAVRRALPCLEDAFRTATLPDAGMRLVFVRRLNLGRLPRADSAQRLARVVESRFSEAGLELVHAGDAGAGGAQAVWFRDPLEAHELAAQQVAAGRSMDAWFWPLVVPQLTGAASRADQLRTLAFSLASRDEAPAALPAWTRSLACAGHTDRLFAALRPGDGKALLLAAGVAASPADRRSDSASTNLRRGVDGDRSNAERPQHPAARRDGPPVAASDDRLEFIERMLIGTPWRPGVDPRSSVTQRIVGGSSEPAHCGDPNRSVSEATTPSTATRAPSIASARGTRTVEASTGRTRAVDLAIDRVEHDFSTPNPDQLQAPTPDRSSRPTRDGGQLGASIAADAPSNLVEADAPRSPGIFPDAAPTAAGGLLFVVPALEQLGVREWCANLDPPLAAPDELARLIFELLLSRLRVAEDDPAWTLAASTNDERSTEIRTFAGIWLTACRRLLRRHVRIGLASLVLRPARLMLTATHADVFFALHAADLRVRRAGLDIDPGWVPWLAKVVAFHYEDRSWT